MSPASTSLPAVSRIASAAGAMAITSVLLLAVGLGFSAPASAETASRPVQVASAPSDAVPVAPNANVGTPYIRFTPQNLSAAIGQRAARQPMP